MEQEQVKDDDKRQSSCGLRGTPCYEAMLEESKELIRCWYEAWGGNVYVAFSGGKDSTALLHMVRSIFPEVPAVFFNTGLEFPEIVKFVKSFENVVIRRPAMNFKQVIEKYGYPVISKEQAQYIRQYRKGSEGVKKLRWEGGWKVNHFCIREKWKPYINAPFEISEQCCDVLKKRPAKKYVKETGRMPFLGMMSDDSDLRLQQIRLHGCNAYELKNPTSKPLGKWNTEMVWEYINREKISYCSIYNKGYKRTGCIFCMFGVHMEREPNRFQRLEKTHPKLWEYCMENLGIKEVLNYMRIPYKERQLSMFEVAS